MRYIHFPPMVNSPVTTLVESITAAQITDIEVVDGSKLPDGPNLATIGVTESAETIFYMGKNGNLLINVSRGFQGQAQAWSKGTYISRVFTAHDLSVLQRKDNLGYRLVDVLYFTSDAEFKKLSHLWLRAVRVKCQGGGGAGGSISNNTGASGGGSGGGYAESFIKEEVLLASVSVTVGKGGSSVAGGTGGSGGDSSFGNLVVATGGGGGNANGGTSSPGRGTVGDLLIYGSWGVPAGEASTGISASGPGGSSFMGGGGSGYRLGTSGNGGAGRLYGGGGGGCRRGSSGTSTGGDGADGIVIVELYT